MSADQQNPAELEADLRTVRRQVQDLDRALGLERARADQLEAALEGKTQEAARLRIERDEQRTKAAQLAAAYLQLEEASAIERREHAGSSALARWAGHAVATDFAHFLPDLQAQLLALKPGRIPELRLDFSLALLAPKELPDLRSPGFARKELLAKIEPMLLRGYVPLLLHLRQLGLPPGGAQSLHVIGCRQDGLLDPDRGEPDLHAMGQSLRALTQKLLGVVGELEARGSSSESPGSSESPSVDAPGETR